MADPSAHPTVNLQRPISAEATNLITADTITAERAAILTLYSPFCKP